MSIKVSRKFELLTVCLLILLAAGLSSTYLVHPVEHFDADEAIVGLMGRHVLNGHLPAYFYGQGYMGSLEAIIAAGYFAAFGSSIFTLKLAPLTFYILFLILQYNLIRKYGGVALALTTLAITVVFSETIILWSTKARGGFPETLFWGTLAYTLFFRLMDGYLRGKGKGWRGGLILGFTIGIGLWNCSMVAYYYLPIALYLVIFGINEIKVNRSYPHPVTPINIQRTARWRSAIRRGGRFIIPLVGIYLLFGLITAINGEITISVFGLDIRSHHGGRDIIRGLSIMLLLVAILAWERSGFDRPITILRKFNIRYPVIITVTGIIVALLLVMAGINLYFQQLPDYSYGHYQPLGPAEGLNGMGNNISQLFTLLLPKVIGVSYSSFKLDLGRSWLTRYSGTLNGWTTLGSIVFVIFLLIVNFNRQRNLVKFLWSNRLNIFFLTSFLGSVSALTFSSMIKDSTAYRYLIPVISWFPFFLASCCIFIWRKNKWGGIMLAFLIIGGHAARLTVNLPLPQATTPEPLVMDIIESLEKERITRAFINYWLAYPITFITGEEIIAAPYQSHDRYPPYTREVRNSPEFAYIFKGYRQLSGKREENMLTINQTAYRKKCYPWGYLLIIGGRQAEE